MADRSELALQLTDAIAAARAAVQHAGNRAFRAYGLSHRAHAALNAVDASGADGARPKEVAAALGVSRAAATTFIQRLEAKGLVETTPDPEDDRGVRVTLTRHGLEVLLRPGHRGDAGLEHRSGGARAGWIQATAGGETDRRGAVKHGKRPGKGEWEGRGYA